MIARKSEEEIAIMRQGGQKLGIILDELWTFATPGATLLSIDQKADELITAAGGSASFKTVKDYRWATCLCVNQVVVHGIPTDQKLNEGDVLTIDIGMVYKALHTDTAWTKIIHASSPVHQEYEEKERFLGVGEKALWDAIQMARVGNRIGHISHAIQENIEGAGYSIVKTLVGHGVGKTLHEEPQIPGFLRGPIERTPELIEGMTVAIEVIYAQGSGEVVYDNDDGWTIATKDRSLSAVFEHSIAITSHGPIVLTKSED